MGSLKALLPFCGRPLIEHQVRSLNQAGASRVIVIVGHDSERLVPILAPFSYVDWVHNPHYLEGKTTSIKTGVRALTSGGAPPPSAVLVLNVDQPRNSDIIRQTIEAHQQRSSAGKAPLITIPAYKGKGGHPIILDASLLPEMLEISEEDQGMKALVRKYQDRSQKVEMGTEEVLFDLNTRDDYQKALGYFKEAGSMYNP